MSVLCIPTVGTNILLVSAWTFRLYREDRNEKLGNLLWPDFLTGTPPRWRWGTEDELIESERKAYEIHLKSHRKQYGVSGKEPMSFEEYSEVALLGWRRQWTDYEQKLQRCKPAFEVFTFPAGSKLTVDRIYIRSGAPGYDSLSFWSSSKLFKGRMRFWAKLEDVNGMECELS